MRTFHSKIQPVINGKLPSTVLWLKTNPKRNDHGFVDRKGHSRIETHRRFKLELEWTDTVDPDLVGIIFHVIDNSIKITCVTKNGQEVDIDINVTQYVYDKKGHRLYYDLPKPGPYSSEMSEIFNAMFGQDGEDA